MIGLAIDENFNNDILRGLLRRNPGLDIVRIQDAGLRTLDDNAVLAWCASQKMPGVFEVPRSVAASIAIEDLRLIAECSMSGEWEGQVRYLPLR